MRAQLDVMLLGCAQGVRTILHEWTQGGTLIERVRYTKLPMQLGKDEINGFKQGGREFPDADVRFKLVGVDIAHYCTYKVDAAPLQPVDCEIGGKENRSSAFLRLTNLLVLVEEEELWLAICV